MSFRIERGNIHSTDYNRKNPNLKIANEFKTILEESIDNKKKDFKISAHAQQRLEERDIDLKEEDLNLINEAINNLEKKGAKDSLMLYKDVAFIASINNRTIITALQYEDVDVVTNIDSAIVVK